MSAVVIVVTGIIAVLLTGVGTFIALPVLDDVYQSSPVQNMSADSPARIAADTNYQITSMMAMLFMGAIFLAMYARAARRESGSIDF